MCSNYFEQLHREEIRRAEWAMLDRALTASSSSVHAGHRENMRVIIGCWLVQLGSRLAGQNVPCYCGGNTSGEQ